MNKNLNPNKENYSAQELDIERALRPLSFDDFAGQEAVLENLKVFVKAANMRNEALPFFTVPRAWVKLHWLTSWLMSWG